MMRYILLLPFVTDECPLCALSVVHIPIDNQDTTNIEEKKAIKS